MSGKKESLPFWPISRAERLKEGERNMLLYLKLNPILNRSTSPCSDDIVNAANEFRAEHPEYNFNDFNWMGKYSLFVDLNE